MKYITTVFFAACIFLACASNGDNNKKTMKVIAHRGGASLGPENTISCIQKGILSCADAADLKPKGEYGFIITNPPYGVRLEDIENAKRIYSGFAGRFNDLKTWSAYIITPIEETESLTGRKADKKRKVYNGMLKTDFYAFLGKKPGKDELVKEAEKNLFPRPKAEKQKKQDETAIKEPASKHLTNISKRKFTTSK